MGCRPHQHAQTGGHINGATRYHTAGAVWVECYLHIHCCAATPHIWWPLHVYSALKQHSHLSTLHTQVLAVCKEYHVRLTGQLHAQLQCLTQDAGKWFLLLDATDRSALCAVLHQHEQHKTLLQTVTSWLASPEVCLQCSS